MATIRGQRRRHYINLGGGLANVGAIRWGFRAPYNSYKNINGGLGVVFANDTTDGIVYGVNSPRPARVRISYTDSNLGGGTANDNVRSVQRYCEYDKLNSAIMGGSINGKKINVAGAEYPINSTTLA